MIYDFDELRDIGKFLYLQSSTQKDDMPYSYDARYQEEYGRWYVRGSYGYVHDADGKAELEATEFDTFCFWRDQPNAKYKNTYGDLWYGDATDGVESGFAILTEYDGPLSRSIGVDFNHLTFEELDKLEYAFYVWHMTDVLDCGSLPVSVRRRDWSENEYLPKENPYFDTGDTSSEGWAFEDDIPFA